MATRWLIRLTLLTGMMSVAAFAADRAAPSGGGGGGGKGGGAAAAPANPPAKANPTPPQRNQPQPAPEAGNSRGGGRDDARPANGQNGTARGNNANRNGPPTAGNAAEGTRLRGQINRDQLGDGRRGAGNDVRGGDRAGDLRGDRLNHRRMPYDPQYVGWAPYSWWYSGNSYWWPAGGYDNDGYGYRDNVAPRTGEASSPSVNNATPSPAEPSATLDQARNQNELEGSPAYAQMVVEMKKAQAIYDTASQKAIEKLKGDPEYQALVKQRDRAEDRVEAVQASAKIPSPEQVTPAAQQKLDVSARVTRMEQDAINADPEAKAAKDKLVELNERLTALRKQANIPTR